MGFQYNDCEDCAWLRIENKKLKQLLKQTSHIINLRLSDLLQQSDPNVTQNDYLRNMVDKEYEFVLNLSLEIEKILK